MSDLILLLDEHLRLVVVLLIGTVVLLGTVARCVARLWTAHSREHSRREIAAYIAEGSITPEHGERLLRVGVGVVQGQHA